jgi:hypothetical protein
MAFRGAVGTVTVAQPPSTAPLVISDSVDFGDNVVLTATPLVATAPLQAATLGNRTANANAGPAGDDGADGPPGVVEGTVKEFVGFPVAFDPTGTGIFREVPSQAMLVWRIGDLCRATIRLVGDFYAGDPLFPTTSTVSINIPAGFPIVSNLHSESFSAGTSGQVLTPLLGASVSLTSPSPQILTMTVDWDLTSIGTTTAYTTRTVVIAQWNSVNKLA